MGFKRYVATLLIENLVSMFVPFFNFYNPENIEVTFMYNGNLHNRLKVVLGKKNEIVYYS